MHETGNNDRPHDLACLGLELPAKRRSFLVQFFAGLKPLRPEAYASLLRAIARALIEAGLVPVTRDRRHDPVELIAAALEISMEQWDLRAADRASSTPPRVGFWTELATRVAAFESLFSVRARGARWDATLGGLVSAIDGDGALVEPIAAMFHPARLDVAGVVNTEPEHAEAMLVEIVVTGSRSFADGSDACGPKALLLALGMALVRADRIAEALVQFETILMSVPGHTIALQQAARCCVKVGAVAEAEAYSRRAAGCVEYAHSRFVKQKRRR